MGILSTLAVATLGIGRPVAAQTGVTLLKDVAPGAQGSFPFFYNTIGDKALITIYRGESSTSELWCSNGTPAGTVFIRHVNQGTRFLESYLGNVSGHFLFAVRDPQPSNYTIYKTDGTLEGTSLVKATGGGVKPVRGVVFNGSAYFQAYTSTAGYELWRSDGTPGGTDLMLDLNPTPQTSSPANGNPSNFLLGDSYFYFTGYSPTGFGIWRSDGTVDGTTMIIPISQGQVTAFANKGDSLFYVLRTTGAGSSTTFYRANGVSGAATAARDIGPSADVDDRSALARGMHFVTIRQSATGWELWQSDGTLAGTHMVRDMNPGPGDSGIRWIRTAGNRVVFARNDGISGEDLWITDGTEQGTMLAVDVAPGQPTFATDLLALAASPSGEYYFFAASAPEPPIIANRLYRLNVYTLEVTKFVSPSYSYPSALTFGDSLAYFGASHPTASSEPFVVPANSLAPPPPPTDGWTAF